MPAKKKLIIVESPTKVKTIKRFLGENVDVEASGGHVRDLPLSRMGVDLEHDYEPSYITIRGKGEIISQLKAKAKKADQIFLATDPDREGEAIAWHLTAVLKNDAEKCRRVSFNEITKTAVKEALKNARDLDMDLINAQQARRVLDRVAGYSVSPLLWKKVKRGLSAGRVQSATLHMVCVREAEIAAFVPQEFWELTMIACPEGSARPIRFTYVSKDRPLTDEAAVKALLTEMEGQEILLTEVETQQKRTKAPLPYTTSTLQQDASRYLNFSPKKTMNVAQQLYEGVDLKPEGRVGLITYLRTDSTRISEEAAAAAEEYIRASFGEAYVGRQSVSGKNTGRSQDAHEAIRPSLVSRTPASVKDQLSGDEFRLYNLIWRRFMASRMEDYCFNSTAATASVGPAQFRAVSHDRTFDGFRQVYNPDKEKAVGEKFPAGFGTDTRFGRTSFEPEQHFTQPPAHYTEASLVHAMETCGIGRPSTYAPTLATLSARRYLTREGKNLLVTELGEAVDRLTEEAVPMLTDRDFTARMEDELDKVAEGSLEWKAVLREFYPPFKARLDDAMERLDQIRVADEESDEDCPNCGRRLVIKYGPHGRFLACPGYPECRFTKPLLQKAGYACPKCGADVVVKRTKNGRVFYACSDPEHCDYVSWRKEK